MWTKLFLLSWLLVGLLFSERAFISADNVYSSELIDKVFASLGKDPNALLNSIYAEADELLGASPERVADCYENTIDDEVVDMFKEPLGLIVRKYLQAHGVDNDIDPTNLKQIKDRTSIILDNLAKIAHDVVQCSLNRDVITSPGRIGITGFAAYTSEEFSEKFLNFKLAPPGTKRKIPEFPCARTHVPPNVKEFNWADQGVVSRIKNQNPCGSCYIFGASGAMEGAFMRSKLGANVSFSEQELLDCVPKVNPCKGGDPIDVFDYAYQTGVVLEQNYRKYNGKQEQCVEPSSYITRPRSFCFTQYKGDEDLAGSIYHYGPVTISINAKGLETLKGPLLPGKWCNNTSPVNHSVLGVGWNKDYWIIKNSWGRGWGVNGYLWIPKNHTNNCLIYTHGFVPMI